MPPMLLAIAAVVGGLALLTVAADRFVSGAAATAARFGVPAVVVGAVIVGFGTSAPELVVSALAAKAGSLEIAAGNIIGSNLANLTLVLGAASLVAATRPSSRVLKVELPAAVAATVAFAVAVQGGLTRTEGLLLLAGLAVAVVVLLRGASEPDELETADAPTGPALGPLVWTVVGLAGVLAGAQALVWGAQSLAAAVGLGEGLVGLTLVAVGTSAPELATGVSAARRGHHELLIGNVLGSNLLNSLAVGAAAALVGPGRLDAPTITGTATVVMLVVTAVTAAVLLVRRRVGRGAGVALIAAWVATVPLVA